MSSHLDLKLDHEDLLLKCLTVATPSTNNRALIIWLSRPDFSTMTHGEQAETREGRKIWERGLELNFC